MKTSIKTFAVTFALLATVFTANAEEKETNKAASFGTGIYSTKSGKINVLVDKVNTDAATTLLLKDKSGRIVYRETIEKSNQKFGRSLNVEDLEAGKYEIQISSKGEMQSKSFELSEHKTERVLEIK